MVQDDSRPTVSGFEFTEDEVAQAIAQQRPLAASLMLSPKCNLKCAFCFTDAGAKFSQRQLGLDEYKRLIGQFAEMGIRRIYLTGRGEPTMDPVFFPLLRHVQSMGNGMMVNVFTNLLLLAKPGFAQRIAEFPVSLIGKLLTFDQGTYERMTGGIKGSFAKAMQGLENAMAAGFNKSRPTRLGMNMLVTRENAGEVCDMMRFCVANNIYGSIDDLLCIGRGSENFERLVLPPEEFSALAAKAGRIQPHEGVYGGGGCLMSIIAVSVDFDGQLMPCTGVFQPGLGSVRDMPVRELYNAHMGKVGPDGKAHPQGKGSQASEELYAVYRDYIRKVKAGQSAGMCAGRRFALLKNRPQPIA
ncbi:MAG: radical SAM protein [Candidatus Micrarchaeia archaeon]|jgi:MoaA/NifB/PqqE/SkfB family radical SAM enzyme